MLRQKINLDEIPDEKLLELRISDIDLKIEGTWIKESVQELYGDLKSKRLTFKPHCYLADEWLTPDMEPVIGIPFYLAHPALIRLEHKMMLDVEGGTKPWCLKLLRHEAGHAINYAYQLYKRKKWQKLFGSISTEYQETYKFRAYSRNYVLHLKDYYAQYHPDEDFAETFAVWLTPELNWKESYKGWKALEKLTYVDELMQEIKDQIPAKLKGRKYWHISSLRLTLKNYYKKKQTFNAEEFPDFHDKGLKNIFFPLIIEGKVKSLKKYANQRGLVLAGEFMLKNKKHLLNTISSVTREKKYIIDNQLKIISKRCKALRLAVKDNDPLPLIQLTSYITALIMNYKYTGRFRGNQ